MSRPFPPWVPQHRTTAAAKHLRKSKTQIVYPTFLVLHCRICWHLGYLVILYFIQLISLANLCNLFSFLPLAASCNAAMASEDILSTGGGNCSNMIVSVVVEGVTTPAELKGEPRGEVEDGWKTGDFIKWWCWCLAGLPPLLRPASSCGCELPPLLSVFLSRSPVSKLDLAPPPSLGLPTTAVVVISTGCTAVVVIVVVDFVTGDRGESVGRFIGSGQNSRKLVKLLLHVSIQNDWQDDRGTGA